MSKPPLPPRSGRSCKPVRRSCNSSVARCVDLLLALLPDGAQLPEAHRHNRNRSNRNRPHRRHRFRRARKPPPAPTATTNTHLHNRCGERLPMGHVRWRRPDRTESQCAPRDHCGQVATDRARGPHFVRAVDPPRAPNRPPLNVPQARQNAKALPHKREGANESRLTITRSSPRRGPRVRCCARRKSASRRRGRGRASLARLPTRRPACTALWWRTCGAVG